MHVGWLMLIGTAIQMFGQYRQNMAQAAQEQQNAQWYKEEADYARYAAARRESLITTEYTGRYGTQASKYISGNVDLSGSAAITLGDTLSQMTREVWAAREKGRMEAALADMRSDASADRSRQFRDPTYNLLQGAAIGINSYASYLSNAGKQGKNLGEDKNRRINTPSPTTNSGSLFNSGTDSGFNPPRAE